MSLGTCEVFSWPEGGTKEGPAKFVLDRLLMKDSPSSCRNSQAPSSPFIRASGYSLSCHGKIRSVKPQLKGKIILTPAAGGLNIHLRSGMPAGSG